MFKALWAPINSKNLTKRYVISQALFWVFEIQGCTRQIIHPNR